MATAIPLISVQRRTTQVSDAKQRLFINESSFFDKTSWNLQVDIDLSWVYIWLIIDGVIDMYCYKSKASFRLCLFI